MHRQFIAEGSKVALEWLHSDMPIDTIVATAEWHAANTHVIARHPEAAVHIASDDDLTALSALHTPSQVLLVLPYAAAKDVPNVNEWYLALDDIQDPGNMGTLIRIADWFGIRHLVCSPNCVDVYNPKVVQSAMGSHIRVNIYEAPLADALPALSAPKFAATLSGSDVYQAGTHESGVLIIGNESKGISPQVMALATHWVTIPRTGGAESLNAAVSAGILCALLLPR
ncbi:RNA methyltransferase [Nemorincola caseinilytica]|uniref:RNA methyltransferase n=2 Tax=Nemorincola caseinilytica TaxID=2054315 RepID=A0ABP8NPB5_9BACT